MINLEQEFKYLDASVAKADFMKKRLPALKEVFDKIDGLNFVFFYADGKVICGVKTRNDFAPIRALHKGVWKKRVESPDLVEYKAEIDGITFYVKVSELPPSCHIVEEIVDVPAVEAHKAVSRRVVCTGGTKEEMALKQVA